MCLSENSLFMIKAYILHGALLATFFFFLVQEGAI